MHFVNPFIQFPRTLTGLLALAALLLGLVAGHLRLNPDPEALLAGDQRTLAAFQIVDKALQKQLVILVDMECDELFTRGNLGIMRSVGDQLAALPGVLDVKSLTHSAIPARQGLSLIMRPFLPEPLTPTALRQTRAFALSHPLVKNVLVSADGRHGMILVAADPVAVANHGGTAALTARIDQVVAAWTVPGRSFQVISAPHVTQELSALFTRDLLRFGVLTAAFIAACSMLYFRTWRMLLFVLLMMSAYAALLGGLAVLSGYRIELSTLTLLPLLLAAELTQFAHFCRVFAVLRVAGRSVDETLRETIHETWRSCLFAALTTAGGLLALSVSGLSSAASFGIPGSVGTLLGLLLLFGPGVALLHVLFRQAPMGQPPRPHCGFDRFAAFCRAHQRLITVAGALLFLAALPGLWRIKTDLRITGMLPASSHSRQVAETLEHAYGGRHFLQLSLETGKPNGVFEYNVLETMQKIQDYAVARPGVTAVYSLASTISMINEVWENWAPGANRLPNPLKTALFVQVLKGANFPLTNMLADEQWQACNIFIRADEMDADGYLKMVADLQAYAAPLCPPGTTLQISPGLHTFLQADRQMRQGQVRSAVVAIAVVAAMLLLLWRSLRLAALATLLVAIPVLVTLALAGYVGIPLNSITFTVAAIATGITVDNIVHIITSWCELRKELPDDQAVTAVLRLKGSPVCFSSILFIGMFGAFGAFSFPPAAHFGILAATAFALSLLTILVGSVLFLRSRRSSGLTIPYRA